MLPLHGPMSSRAPGPNRSDANGKTPVTDVQRPQGLYDPAFEHDSCGVGFVVDLHGRAQPPHRRARHRVRCATSTTAARPAPRPTPATAPGSSCRCRTASSVPSSTSSSRPTGAYAAGMRVPADGPQTSVQAPWRAIEKIVASEGAASCSVGATCPTTTRCSGRWPRDAEPTFKHCSSRRGRRRQPHRHRSRPAHVRRAQAHRARDAGAPYFPSLSAAHARLQGHAHHAAARRTSIPISSTSGSSRRSRSCTRGSRRTRSRPGRSRTRTGIIAHNGEINTVKGNQNWMRAREALLRDALMPGLDRAYPICTPGASDTCRLRRGARAAASRRPLAPALGADDDPGGVGEPRVDAGGQARLLPVPRVAHGAVGRPGVDRVHRRHGDRRGARPQRSAPVALLGHRRRTRRHGERGRRARHRRPRRSCSKGRLQPGRMFLVDTSQGRIIGDDEIKAAARGRAAVRRVAARRARPPRRPAARAASSRRSTARSCSNSARSATRPRS